MTVNISNMGMIKSVDEPIKFNGITVIAGNNSTGKSTVRNKGDGV